MRIRQESAQDIGDKLADLGMDGDMDDVELLADVEAIFDIAISNEEAEKLESVGDLFELLKSKLNLDQTAGKCRTAMTFYSLRRQLQKNAVNQQVRPKTSLSALNIKNVRKFLSARQTDLKMPTNIAAVRYDGVASALAIGLFLVTVLGGLVSKYAALSAGLLFLSTIAYLGFAALHWKPAALSVGELAEKIAAKNYAKLSAQGAGNRCKDIWRSLTLTLAEHCDIDVSKIAEATTFYGQETRR